MSGARERPGGEGEAIIPGCAEATPDDRLRRAISIETVGVLFFRLDGRILDANAAFERMSGYTVRELRATTPWESLTPPEFREVAARAAAELAERGETAPFEKQLLRRDGSRWWGLVAPTRLAGSGREAECVEFVLDITAAKENEAALRESEERHRLIVEGARDYAIITTDAGGRIESWSPGAEAVFGWTADEIVGEPVARTFIPEDLARGAPEEERAEAAATGSAPDVRWHLRKDGERVFIEGVTRALAGPGGEARGFLKIGQDVTRRRATEDALRELNESLERRVAERTAELAAEIAERERAEAARGDVLRQRVTVEEEERRRISRELHDSLGQLVTGLMLGLKALERDPGQLSHVHDLQRLADRIAREMQDMAVQLRPPALDSLGLAPALRNHLEEWSARHGVACDFHALGIEGGRLRPEVEATVYRVVQEGLNNVLKHAGARHVSLVLERRGGVLSAILEDDGAGFDVEATLASPEKAKRLGVRGMRERVALLGGELEIESSPGAGTSLFVRIPEPPADA